jgi:TolA-binding protein
LERYKEALPTLQECLGLSGYTDDMRTFILLHAGQSASQMENWQQAIDLCAKIVADYPESKRVPEAIYEQGWAQQKLGNHAEAMKLYQAAADRSRTAVGARARFMLGGLYFNEKQHETAIKEYQRVVFGYGGDDAPKSVQNWQARSAYEIARCYEAQIRGAETPAKRQECVEGAKRFYTMVVEKFPDSPDVALAAQRIKALNALP